MRLKHVFLSSDILFIANLPIEIYSSFLFYEAFWSSFYNTSFLAFCFVRKFVLVSWWLFLSECSSNTKLNSSIYNYLMHKSWNIRLKVIISNKAYSILTTKKKKKITQSSKDKKMYIENVFFNWYFNHIPIRRYKLHREIYLHRPKKYKIRFQ